MDVHGLRVVVAAYVTAFHVSSSRGRSRLSAGRGRPGRAIVEALLHDLPADVLQEGLDVLALLSCSVVDHPGVLEDVQDENRMQADRMVDLMVADPPVDQPPCLRVVVEDHPPDAAYRGRSGEFLPPRRNISPFRGQRRPELTLRAQRGAGLQVVEVVLVEHHPVELEPKAAPELAPFARSALRRLDLPEELVGVLHVSFVQMPMLLDLLVGNALEPARFQVLLYV